MGTLAKDFICSDKHTKLLGFNALYDVMDQSELPEGSTVVAILDGGLEQVIFQTAVMVDIFDAEEVSPIVGTSVLVDNKDEKVNFISEDAIRSYPISSLRFPTKDELDWYNRLDMV